MRFCKPIKSFYQLPATVPIATKVKPIKKFYKAEKYHQDYIAKNPNGYCPDHSTGIKFAKKDAVPMADNSDLISGKHIIVIEAEGYCPVL
jgi:peptide methionine sulfoxide reductase msrA/msrB